MLKFSSLQATTLSSTPPSPPPCRRPSKSSSPSPPCCLHTAASNVTLLQAPIETPTSPPQINPISTQQQQWWEAGIPKGERERLYHVLLNVYSPTENQHQAVQLHNQHGFEILAVLLRIEHCICHLPRLKQGLLGFEMMLSSFGI